MIFEAKQQEIPQFKPLLRKTPKAKNASKKQRFLLAGLFLFTVILSGVFYLKTELVPFKKKISQPLVISNISEKEKFDPSAVLDKIENLTKDLLGTYGVYVYRFADKNEYGIREEEIFPAASLMKLPVMLLVYQEGEKKELNLDDYRELVRVMGQRSDNATYNQLVKFFGQKKIQELIEELGMASTILAKDDTTPKDIGLFFRKLYLGNLIQQIHKEEFLSFLTETNFEDRITAGIPEDIRVAHKIGTEIGSYSDAGIVFGEKLFVLVIMSKDAREAEATEVLPKITAAVWDFEEMYNFEKD